RNGINSVALAKNSFADLKASRLVFVNGHFAKEFSTILPQPEGIKFSNLAAALQSDSALLEKYLGRHAKVDDNAFAALNTAFFQDGAFIFVPAGKSVAEPVHLLFVSTSSEEGATTHPRNLIVAEKSSKLTVIESYVATAEGSTFTN